MQAPFTSHIEPVTRNPTALAHVLGVAVAPVDLERALARVAELVGRRQKGYVCAVSVHGVLEARRNPRVAQAFGEAAMVIADGRPVVWVGRLQDHHAIRQVTGPDMMRAIFTRPEFAGCSHFFYGGKEGVAAELATMWQERFPGTRIAGTYTPPFRDLTLAEEADVVAHINRSRPDFIWIGISTPRQELLMQRLLPQLDCGLLFGVGAAFDFHTGRIRDCAPWIKRIGFQWLHRLVQDPARLWRRNLYNMTFLWHIALQLTGLKTYSLDPSNVMQIEPAARQVASQPDSA